MTDQHEKVRLRRLVGGEIDVAIVLFRHGMVWDGNVPSKSARDSLVAGGFAVRHEGQQALTGAGTIALLMTPAFWKWAARYAWRQRRNPVVSTRAKNREAMR